MKTRSLIWLVVGMIHITAFEVIAKMINLRVSRTGTNEVQYAFDDRVVTEDELNRILGKLGNICTNCQINVLPRNQATASDLLVTLHRIQTNGLHNVAIYGEGTITGSSGTISLSVDVSKRPIGTCIANTYDESGFQPSLPVDGIEEIERNLPKVDK